MKFFNTAGPCDPRFHYMLPAAERLPEARVLIDQGGYFAVHAPRQTGKTTTLRALARELTAEGKYAALKFSCETGEPAGDNYAAAQRAVLTQIRMSADVDLPADLRPPAQWPTGDDLNLLGVGLAAWARQCTRPLVLFFDEIDALRGESLRAVLRQLRSMYELRPDAAPWAVALCGLRDVRDYKAASGGDASRLGTSSPFNIMVKSFRLGDFSQEEVRALYDEHTRETKQPFTDAAMNAVFENTAGQPWLVNALAREITREMKILPPTPVEASHVLQAKERLILARATHLDSLVAKLHEPRVRAVIEPLIAGDESPLVGDPYEDEASYVRDLGLIARDRPLRIANPIYREVIVRVLSSEVQDKVTLEPSHFVLPDGRFDLRKMLEEFAAFWKRNGDIFAARMPYHEVAPQLVLMAFLQRIVNGGGYVEREYGIGRGRIDLAIRWPLPNRGQQEEAIELKVWREGRPDPLGEGLEQLQSYLDRLGLKSGTLIIFDRRNLAAPIDQRTRFESAVLPKGAAVTVLRA